MIDGPLHFSGCTPLWGLGGLSQLSLLLLGRVPHDEPHIPFCRWDKRLRQSALESYWKVGSPGRALRDGDSGAGPSNQLSE